MSTPFYDLASLVVVPSGYKAAKIYAQKPLTTDGQLAFTRASTATRVNASGLVEAVASGVPRLDYLNSSCPRLLLEPQRTNVATYSEQFDNAAWSKLRSTITANNTTSPAGYSDADLLVADTSAGDHVFFRSATASISQTFSIFAKAGGYNFVFIGADNQNDRGVFFNLTNGTISQNTSTLTAKIEDYGNGWYRCAVSSASWPQAFVVVDTSANGTTIFHTGNGTSGVYVWGAQVEEGAYATSYIPTLGASVTRVADACSKTGISSLIGQTEGVIFVDFVASAQNQDGSSFSIITIFGSAAENLQLYTIGSALRWYSKITSGIVLDRLANQTLVAGQRYKVAFAYKSGEYALYINGVQKDTSTASGVPTTSQFNFNTDSFGAGNAKVENKFNQVLVFKTRLTNAQLAELTA